MGFMGRFMNAITAGTIAFREQMLNVDPTGIAILNEYDTWGRWDSRRLRYDIYWAMYQNTTYNENIHYTWASAKNTLGGQYKHDRCLYNPAGRLVEFWASRTMGGRLDPKAGDGEVENSALPIVTDNESIRKGLQTLWKDSRWEVNKDLYCRFGACMGDVGLRIDDDPINKRITMRPVHPGNIVWVDRDPANHDRLLGYIIQERRYDPRVTTGKYDGRDPNLFAALYVWYTEEARLEGDQVHYKTFMNFEPYAWNGISPEWSVDIPFIPLELAQHETFGADWGINCFHGGQSRFIEVDDQASGLSDQIRKSIRGPWLMIGQKDPKTTVNLTTFNSNTANPQADRAEDAFLYAMNPNAKAQSLVFPLDILGVCEHLRMLLTDIEKNYPELLANPSDAAGDGSGRALRTARQVASSKVQSHRANYDSPLVRAQSKALALGGHMGYKGYEGFDYEDMHNGKLDHSIGHRPVFEIDPADEQEAMATFWANANSAIQAGVPLSFFLEEQGWPASRIARLEKSQASAHADMAAQAATTAGPGSSQHRHPPNGVTAVPPPPGVGKSG